MAEKPAEKAAPASKIVPPVPLASLAAAEMESKATHATKRGPLGKPRMTSRPPVPIAGDKPAPAHGVSAAADASNDPEEQRRARREAAMRVLAELAAEEDVVTPPPEQIRR